MKTTIRQLTIVAAVGALAACGESDSHCQAHYDKIDVFMDMAQARARPGPSGFVSELSYGDTMRLREMLKEAHAVGCKKLPLPRD